MLGNVDIDSILLLLLALEQDWLYGIDECCGISTDAEDLLDCLHDLIAFGLLQLGLGDWHDESHIATICEKHFDCEVVDALSKLVVSATHAWQVGVDLVVVDSKMGN